MSKIILIVLLSTLKFQNINRQNIILVIAIMFLIVPFIELLLQWNMTINFPEWVMHFNIDSDELITAFLQMDTFWDLFGCHGLSSPPPRAISATGQLVE